MPRVISGIFGSINVVDKAMFDKVCFPPDPRLLLQYIPLESFYTFVRLLQILWNHRNCICLGSNLLKYSWLSAKAGEESINRLIKSYFFTFSLFFIVTVNQKLEIKITSIKERCHYAL